MDKDKVIDDFDKVESLSRIADDILYNYIEFSHSKTQSSIIQNRNLKINETINICAHCGKPVRGHFENKTFKMGCDCPGAVEEMKRLEKIESFNKEIDRLETECRKLENENNKIVCKHAIPFIQNIREEANRTIDGALNIYKETH